MAVATKNAYIERGAHILGNAKIFGTVVVKDKSVVSGNVKLYDACQVRDTAQLSGDIRGAGTAKFYGDVKVFGNGNFQGQADISSSSDWATFIHDGKTITLYKSRCDNGYEINVDGVDTNLVEISVTISHILAKYLSQLIKSKSWTT